MGDQIRRKPEHRKSSRMKIESQTIERLRITEVVEELGEVTGEIEIYVSADFEPENCRDKIGLCVGGLLVEYVDTDYIIPEGYSGRVNARISVPHGTLRMNEIRPRFYRRNPKFKPFLAKANEMLRKAFEHLEASKQERLRLMAGMFSTRRRK